MTDESKSHDQYVGGVRTDHIIHKFAILAAAGYGWQLHGWVISVALLVGLFIVITVTNLGIVATSSDRYLLRLIRINRWLWVFIAVVALALSGATIATV